MTENLTYIRTKGKKNANITTNQMYDNYLNNLSSKELPLGTDIKNTKYYVDKKKYRNILNDLNEKVMNKIIEQSYEFILPYRLGTLKIIKRKLKIKTDEQGNIIKRKLPVDWKATKELWSKDPKAKEMKIKVFNFNEHFNGYKCIFHWSKGKHNISGLKIYSFTPTRTHKRYLAKTIKSNIFIDYYEAQ
jgi:hypothetical protein